MAECTDWEPGCRTHNDCACMQKYQDWRGDWGHLELSSDSPDDISVIFVRVKRKGLQGFSIFFLPLLKNNEAGAEQHGSFGAAGELGKDNIVFANRQSIYVIGRDSACDVVVNQPSVSGRHFQIYKEIPDELHAIRVNISDISLNGTYVNGTLLKKGRRITSFYPKIPAFSRDAKSLSFTF